MAKENQRQDVNQVPNVEELVKTVSDLSNENRYLRKNLAQAIEQIKFMNVGEIYKRIDVLWNIITNEESHKFFSKEFIHKCTADLEEIMFPPVETEEDKEENV